MKITGHAILPGHSGLQLDHGRRAWSESELFMERRTFIRNTAAIGIMASVRGSRIYAESSKARDVSEVGTGTAENSASGCPVRVVSIGYDVPPSLDPLTGLVEREAAGGTDLIILPENCRGRIIEPLQGQTVSAMSQISKRYRTYIAAPIFRSDSNGHTWNSTVFLDRTGTIAYIYDKIYPFFDEYTLSPPVHPGMKAGVYNADFGKVGFATCFDVNFPEVWQDLADKGADLVVWPSAYSGGTALQAHALNHHYYIVTASRERDCIVYDITGKCIFREKAAGPVAISHVTLDLDRSIYHYNFNGEKKKKLLQEHPDDVLEEIAMEPEEWFVLKAKRPMVRARELAAQYGLEELRHYIQRSRAKIDELRGFSFRKDLYCG